MPYQVEFTNEAHGKLAKYLGDIDFHTRIGNHLALLSTRQRGKWEEITPGHWRDEWGVVWNRTVDKDIGVVDDYLLKGGELTGWAPPAINLPGMAEMYSSFVKGRAEEFRIVTIGFSLFERAWSLRGMAALLEDMIVSPEFVHQLLDRVMEWNLAQVDLAVKYDIDAIYFGDDWGSQKGIIMGPRLWREFIKPRVARQYEAVRRAGKYVVIHSCGDVKEILPDLVEVGLNVFNPFQPEVMDVFETKKRYYGKLSFYGGISLQHLLPHGSPDEVRAETRKLLKELGRGGGYIAAPSHSVPPDVPPENLVALIETLQGQ